MVAGLTGRVALRARSHASQVGGAWCQDGRGILAQIDREWLRSGWGT